MVCRSAGQAEIEAKRMACSITRGSHVHGGCKQRSSSVGTPDPYCRYRCEAATEPR